MKLSAVLLSSLLLFAGTVQAQQDTESEAWFYAINETTQVLTAYTASGETNVILEGVVESGISQNIGNNEWIARLRTAEHDGLFVLRPESATYLQPTPEAQSEIDLLAENVPQMSYYPIAAAPPYVVILPVYQLVSGVALLADTETGVLDVLGARRVGADSRQIRFSQDGTRLRYVAELEPQMSALALRERVLETGEERVIYEHSVEAGDLARITGTIYGDHWLFILMKADRTQQAMILSNNGSMITLDQASTDEERLYYTVLGDRIYVFTLPCVNNCRVREIDYQGNSITHFNAPAIGGSFILIGRYANTLILNISGEERGVYFLYSLTENDSPQLMGRADSENFTLTPSAMQSPDGKYLLALTEQSSEVNGYRVWDLESGDILLEYEFVFQSPVASILYGAHGFVSAQYPFNAQAYFFVTETLVEVSGSRGRPFHVMADGTLLVYDPRSFPDRPPGIFHYDPAADASTLLVEGAQPIVDSGL
jgi:hypothetical protein